MIPVILCGGSGSRLWPISDEKLFYNFFDSQSLLDISLKRLEAFESPLIVSQESLKTSAESVVKNNSPSADRIYEPLLRNTAVSFALACHFLRQRRRAQSLIGLFPADHFISQELDFQKLVAAGSQIAQEKGQIVAFGSAPRFPSSDYGYIKVQNNTSSLNGVSFQTAIGFVEKPSLSESESLIQEGCLWNFGIFLGSLGVFIQHFENYLPDLWREICSIKEDFSNISSAYQKLNPLSFDKGIMEKISSYICLPCDVGWFDLGSWDRLADWEREFPGKLQNRARVIRQEAEGSFVFSSIDRNIGLAGAKNLLVIQGEKGLLIAKKGAGRDMKKLAESFNRPAHPADKKGMDQKICRPGLKNPFILGAKKGAKSHKLGESFGCWRPMTQGPPPGHTAIKTGESFSGKIKGWMKIIPQKLARLSNRSGWRSPFNIGLPQNLARLSNREGFKDRRLKPQSLGAKALRQKAKGSAGMGEDAPRWAVKPWGAYRVLMERDGFKYKELKVLPGQQLSCQSHKKRVEHWIVAVGQAEIILEGRRFPLKANEHIFIPQGAKHRLKNPAKKDLILLEIQMGSELDENDIVRYADDYGRK